MKRQRSLPIPGRPSGATLLHYTGVIQFQRNALDEAAATLRRAIALRPDAAALEKLLLEPG